MKSFRHNNSYGCQKASLSPLSLKHLISCSHCVRLFYADSPVRFSIFGEWSDFNHSKGSLCRETLNENIVWLILLVIYIFFPWNIIIQYLLGQRTCHALYSSPPKACCWPWLTFNGNNVPVCACLSAGDCVAAKERSLFRFTGARVVCNQNQW